MIEKEKIMDDEPNKEKKETGFITRRYFLEVVGGGAIGIATAGSVVLTAQFLSPNVLLEPSLQFKAGSPEDYPLGSVTLHKEQKVFIVRAKEGYFYALSTICTHLGCIANWKSEDGIIACPCHGSKFDKDGKVLDGPAPKPLQRFSVILDEQGQLVVDKGSLVGEEVILKV